MNFKNLCFLFLIFLVSISSKSQSFNDGPIGEFHRKTGNILIE